MARKRIRNSKNIKIPRIVIVISLSFIALLTAIIIAVQPSSSERFFKSYESAGANSGVNAAERFTRSNNFKQLNHLDNHGLFSMNQGLINKIKNEDLVIVFFANPNNETSVSSIAHVNFQFTQSALDEVTNTIYHFTTESYLDDNTPNNNLRNIITRWTDEFSIIYDLQPKTYSIPLLIAFYEGEFVQATTPGNSISAAIAKSFYNSVHSKITK